MENKNRKNITFKLLSSFITVVLFFIGFEIISYCILRILDSGMQPSETLKSDVPMPLLSRAPGFFGNDPVLITSLVKGFQGFEHGVHIRINDQGFRGPEFSINRQENTCTILCMGDSITFGWAVEETETYPVQLANMLNSHSTNHIFNVINAGIPTHTSFQGYLRVFRTNLLELQPDIIIISYGFNDMTPHPVTDAVRVNSTQPLQQQEPRSAPKVITNRNTYKLMARLLEPLAQKISDDLPVRVPITEFEIYLQEIIRECLKNDIIPILLEQTYAEIQNPDYNAVKRKLAKSYDIEIVSVEDSIQELVVESGDIREVFLDKCHPTKTGFQVIAEKVFETIIQTTNCGRVQNFKQTP